MSQGYRDGTHREGFFICDFVEGGKLAPVSRLDSLGSFRLRERRLSARRRRRRLVGSAGQAAAPCRRRRLLSVRNLFVFVYSGGGQLLCECLFSWLRFVFVFVFRTRVEGLTHTLERMGEKLVGIEEIFPSDSFPVSRLHRALTRNE